MCGGSNGEGLRWSREADVDARRVGTRHAMQVPVKLLLTSHDVGQTFKEQR